MAQTPPTDGDDDLLLLALGQGSPIPAGTDLAIHADDEMLRLLRDRTAGDRRRARFMYLQSGIALWRTLRRVVEWRFGEAGRVCKLLDFASGYGRVTRFVVRDLPPERVWISDITAAAVDFQCRQFGVHGFVSAPRPEALVCGERFDCILVSSLFTHLPEATFAPWLRRLWQMLAPGGVIAWSVHDAGMLPPGRQLPPGGLLFEPTSESGSLAVADYGSTWVSEGFVRGALGAAAPAASVLRLPKALANYQDLYVAVPESGADFSALQVAAPAQDFVEHCSWAPPDRLEIDGWVTDRASGRLAVEVRATIAGELVGRCQAFTPRPDVAAIFPGENVEAVAWHLAARVPGEPPDLSARLRLEAVEADGLVRVIEESSIEGALLRSTRLQLFLDHDARERLAAEHAALELEHQRVVAAQEQRLAVVREECRLQVAACETRIAAMEASFFWRLRNRWWALKRALRLVARREP
ncbi:MAG TPA: class I SAM-dependent methyltransferase [Thermoanaerobaculia bacterium]|jgi:SAM-dependent methyltransferase|nr:class I SAM-dependent methyltransferase [Thermoanaerobaculia bacterium]